MAMPGFTAESALDRTAGIFRAVTRYVRSGVGLQPAIHCDPICLDDCLLDCTDCYEVPPKYRAACESHCRAHNVGCRHICCH
jgi:hypothetical protein